MATASAPARRSQTRLGALGIILVAFAAVGGVAVIMTIPAPIDDGSTAEVAGVTLPQGTWPEGTPSVGTSRPALSATPTGTTLTVTGALTIISPGSERWAEASTDLSGAEGRPETAWTPVKAELDALMARRESGELSPSEFLDAYRDIGCVGSGAYSDFAPGRSVEILNEAGSVIASGTLQVGSAAGPGAPSGCRLPFTIAGVPAAAVYTVAVGGATLSYTREQLDSRGWNIELEIGPQG